MVQNAQRLTAHHAPLVIVLTRFVSIADVSETTNECHSKTNVGWCSCFRGEKIVKLACKHSQPDTRTSGWHLMAPAAFIIAMCLMKMNRRLTCDVVVVSKAQSSSCPRLRLSFQKDSCAWRRHSSLMATWKCMSSLRPSIPIVCVKPFLRMLVAPGIGLKPRRGQKSPVSSSE